MEDTPGTFFLSYEVVKLFLSYLRVRTVVLHCFE